MSTESKLDLEQFEGHTAGPWEWDERIRTWGLYRKGCAPNCHAQDAGICTIRPDAMGEEDPCGYYPGSPEQKANARLLAAAPDLLAECRRLRAENARLREALEMIFMGSYNPGATMSNVEMSDVARAALAGEGE